MIEKEKIIEILENKEQAIDYINCIVSDDFENIADEIISLFYNLDDDLKERLEDHLKQLRQDQ